MPGLLAAHGPPHVRRFPSIGEIVPAKPLGRECQFGRKKGFGHHAEDGVGIRDWKDARRGQVGRGVPLLACPAVLVGGGIGCAERHCWTSQQWRPAGLTFSST